PAATIAERSAVRSGSVVLYPTTSTFTIRPLGVSFVQGEPAMLPPETACARSGESFTLTESACAMEAAARNETATAAAMRRARRWSRTSNGLVLWLGIFASAARVIQRTVFKRRPEHMPRSAELL